MKQDSSVGYWDGVWIEFKKDSLAYVSFFFHNPPCGDGGFRKFPRRQQTDSAC